MVELAYVNAALTRIGEGEISSLSDDANGAKIANANYELVVSDELGSYPWRWATRVVDLGPPLVGTPAAPWQYARTLPFPVIRTRTVKASGSPISYVITSDQLLSDYDDEYDLEMHAVWRQAEAYWPGQFAELITLRMQQMFLRGIGERHAEADALEAVIERQRARARLSDSQSVPPSNPVSSPTLVARRA